jgi:hypothetical protein
VVTKIIKLNSFFLMQRRYYLDHPVLVVSTCRLTMFTLSDLHQNIMDHDLFTTDSSLMSAERCVPYEDPIFDPIIDLAPQDGMVAGHYTAFHFNTPLFDER